MRGNPGHGKGGGICVDFGGQCTEIRCGPVHPVGAIACRIALVLPKPARRATRSVFPGQQPATQWGIGSNRDALIGAHRQHLHLGLPFDQVVHRLQQVDGQVELVCDPHRLHHLPCGEVRQAHIADLPGGLQLRKTGERFGQIGFGVEAMQVKHIHHIQLQPLTADVKLGAHIGRISASDIPHLGCDQKVIAIGFDHRCQKQGGWPGCRRGWSGCESLRDRATGCAD